MSIRSRGEIPLSSPSEAAHSPRATPDAARPRPAAGRPDFASVVRALGEESDRGQSLVRRAVAGGALAPSQLLALQAGIYRYGEVVDLATRLVDRASTGVKSVLQGQ